MGVPSFADLGKTARDVFKTGYHYGSGLVKLTVRTKTAGSLQLGNELVVNLDASKSSGTMETKYTTKEYGSLLKKWTTDGTLLMGYQLEGKPTEGVGLQSEFTYNPETSVKGAKLTTSFLNDKLNACFAISNDLSSTVNILGSMVVAIKDIFVGYQGGYNTGTCKMTKNDLGIAFNYQDVGFHFRCTSIPYEYGLSLLYKVNDEWDAAVNGILARRGELQEWTMGAATRCKLDTDTTLRFKLNTDLQLGTSLQQRLNEHVTLALSFNVDCANVTRGGHKVGLGLDIEA